MRPPVMTTWGLMGVIAGFGAASAVAVYQPGILLMGILPAIGAIRRASRSERKIDAAVRGGVLWGAVQAGVYDAILLVSLLLMNPRLVLLHALVFLEVSLVLGIVVGLVVGAGFLVHETVAGRSRSTATTCKGGVGQKPPSGSCTNISPPTRSSFAPM